MTAQPSSPAGTDPTVVEPAPRSHSERRIIVSVHDIAPSTAPEVRWLLGELDRMGIRRRVLKVIPNEAGVGDIRADLNLVNLLRDEVAAGSEIVLHGYTHRSAGPPVGNPLLRLGVRIFAPNDSEFATLRRRESARRLALGRDVLGELGLAPMGFCPPAWMAPSTLEGDLADAGFRYIVRIAAVGDVVAGRRHWIPAVGYRARRPRSSDSRASIIPRSRAVLAERRRSGSSSTHSAPENRQPAPRCSGHFHAGPKAVARSRTPTSSTRASRLSPAPAPRNPTGARRNPRRAKWPRPPRSPDRPRSRRLRHAPRCPAPAPAPGSSDCRAS